jgi:hypothetical protein
MFWLKPIGILFIPRPKGRGNRFFSNNQANQYNH